MTEEGVRPPSFTAAHAGEAMAEIREIIREYQTHIFQRWREQVRPTASARGLTAPEFDNILPRFLLALGEATDLGEFSGRRREIIESQLSSRIRQGFDLAEITEEIGALGRAISHVWDSGKVEPPDSREIQSLFSELNAATAAIAEMFRQHMMQDEQTDKRYIRLLQQIANEALTKGGQPFSERLDEVLQLIMEAMQAQAATLLLPGDPESEAMVTAASAGEATGVFEKYVETTHPNSFIGRVAAGQEPTTMLDLQATPLRVDDVLRQKGIHSLLGVRLDPHDPSAGVLYIGLSETRRFSAGDLRRIETLASRLTLHLENARVYDELRGKSAQLQKKVDALALERELREGFVSVLAHDLRGPLSVMNVAAGILLSNSTRSEEHHKILLKIKENAIRMERMIADLLDVARIQAGEPLQLRLDDCNLSALADDIASELRLVYPGRRFILNKEGDIHGIWSSDEVRRAVWNLAINAVKYGDPNEPVTISVRRSDAGAAISVHNHGAVIAPDDQALLFKRFTRSAAKGEEGWGLGLTLVRGAAEAHGGTVSVESNAQAGTTFTINLPADSRPFQPT